MSDWDSYLNLGTETLRNKLGISDSKLLDQTERRLVEARIDEGCPTGNFDLEHLQAIHRHLFQDVYEWAGELRSVSMYKPDSSFMPPDRIETGMHFVHEQLVKADFLRNMNVWEFSDRAAQIIGDINHAHPFREGNGRTQLEFLEQLGARAGHNIDTTRIERAAWIEASIEANRGNYGAMNDQIRAAIVPTLEKTQIAETQAWEADTVERQEAARSVEHPAPTREWEVAREAELNRQEIERRNQSEAQQKALADILEGDRRKGKAESEIEERRRKVEKAHRELQERLTHEQQQRLERLELLYRGPPSERER
ncbi:Fic/DOC family protein [Acidicapsa acidisoli]|uniref:Fic/DOC family protein n=1 Tax=Acidicapsa acidisoli TaxID=1615681 RepID=UPI0021DF490B|nr:Fic family protein [Acidicapsa acidisoli]